MKSVLLYLIVGLVLSACATKKPVEGLPEPISKPKDIVLQLNGDSDRSRAGKLKTVNFAYDSSTLDESAMEILKENAEYMKLNKPISVQIEGHCDERGGRQYNLALGERRAASVRNHMRTLGINPDRMKIISLGNEKPLSTANNEKARAKNRRANYIILSK